jgi:hypothetical protein
MMDFHSTRDHLSNRWVREMLMRETHFDTACVVEPLDLTRAEMCNSRSLASARLSVGESRRGSRPEFYWQSSVFRGEGRMTLNTSILAPLSALVLWSFVMWAWLYATRIPAMVKGRVAYDPRRPAEEFHARLPASVRWKADNYNHLMEQPTLFYAVVLALAVVGAGAGFNTTLAWIYVGLRLVHSLVQALVNIVIWRFSIFMAASVVLLILAIRLAAVVL